MSRFLREKNIPRLMIIVPMLAIIMLTVLIVYFYISYRHQHFKVESERLKQEYIIGEKQKLQERLQSLYLLINTKHQNMQVPMKKELISRINIAYDTATYLHQRHHRPELVWRHFLGVRLRV